MTQFQASQISHSRGFTLVELLLAMMLLAMLAMGAWSAVSTATKAVKSGEALIDRTNRLRVAQELMRRQIGASMNQVIELDSATGHNHMVQGESESFRFVAAMPGFLARGGPYVQEFAFERQDGGTALVFRHQRFNGWDAEKGFDRDIETVVLLNGIRSAEFEYLGTNDQNEIEDWKGEWDKAGKLPLLIRINIDFEEETRMVWPQMEIALKLDVNSGGVPDFYRGFRR